MSDLFPNPVDADDASEPAPTLARVRFPLWAKLGLVFGGVLGVVVTVYGIISFEADLDAEAARTKHRLRGLAETIAAGIDGDIHAGFRTSEDMERPTYTRLRAWLSSARSANDLAWTGTIAADNRDRQYFVVDGSKNAPYPIGYPIFDGGAFRRSAMTRKETVYDRALQDEWGTWQTASAPILNSLGEAVGLVEVADDADAQLLFAAERRIRLLLEILLAVVITALSAILFARWLNRHLTTLTTTALHVAAGELDQVVDIRTRDEIGVLGGAFNTMVTGLRERQHIRDTFGRYVSKEVVSQVLGESSSMLGGEAREVTVLMSDLRGFTSLSEQLGPQRMVALINRYFGCMADVVGTHQGMISEFLGDGMVIYFGAPNKREDDPIRAVACAVAMHRALVAFNASEGRDMEMGIGIATGTVIAGNIGSEERMKYGVVGSTINLSARLEAFTLGNQVLICEATLAACGDALRTGTALTMRAKGRREPVVCHPVRAVSGRFDVEMPARVGKLMMPVDIPVDCFRVTGKEVSDIVEAATARELGTQFVVLETTWEAEARTSYKLSMHLGTDGHVDAGNIYAKVVECRAAESGSGFLIELKFTSIPVRERELLANQLAPV